MVYNTESNDLSDAGRAKKRRLDRLNKLVPNLICPVCNTQPPNATDRRAWVVSTNKRKHNFFPVSCRSCWMKRVANNRKNTGTPVPDLVKELKRKEKLNRMEEKARMERKIAEMAIVNFTCPKCGEIYDHPRMWRMHEDCTVECIRCWAKGRYGSVQAINPSPPKPYPTEDIFQDKRTINQIVKAAQEKMAEEARKEREGG